MNYKDKENVILAKREYDNSVGYKLRTESVGYIGTLPNINKTEVTMENKYLQIQR